MNHTEIIKNIRDAVNTKMYKEKFNHYSTKLSSHKNPKEMWQTLNTIFPKKKYAFGSDSSDLLATKFNEFFISIARNLCNVF